MGPAASFFASLTGFFAFGAIYHAVLWSRARREWMLLAMAGYCLLASINSHAVLSLATATTLAEGQRALDIRSVALSLQVVTIAWLYSILAGVRARWYLCLVAVVPVWVVLTMAAGAPVAGFVSAIDRTTLPWGESLSTLVRASASPGLMILFAIGVSVPVFGLVCARRLASRDRVGAALLAASAILSGASVISALAVDVIGAHLPYPGPAAGMLWLLTIALQVGRTNEQRAQQAVRAEQRLTTALDASGVTLWDCDVTTGHVQLSAQWAALLGHTPGETHTTLTALEQVAHPDDRKIVRQALRRTLVGSAPSYRAEHRVVTADGRWVWVESVGQVVERGPDGRVRRLAGTNREVTDRKRAEAEVERLAYHDATTGLPNRLLFADRVAQAIAYAAQAQSGVAVLLVDVERLGQVNKALHPGADEDVLNQIVERMHRCIRKGETLARLGGYQFIVLMPQGASAASAAELGQRLLDAVHCPLELVGWQPDIRATIGISLYPEDGGDAVQLMRSAEAATSHGKVAGPGQVHFHCGDMTDRAQRRRRLTLDLAGAADRDELDLVYQPLIDSRTEEIVGAEALLRWHHPAYGVVTPAELIPIAEDVGMIQPLGEWVLRRACTQARTWQVSASHPFSIAVNLSLHQLAQPELTSLVDRLVDSSRSAFGTLTIELTESEMLHSDTGAMKTLRSLRQVAGVRLVIDDFGTGYSNFDALRRAPFDGLKVDRTFVHGLGEGPDGGRLLAGIIATARALQIAVTVEGVETSGQYECVRALGCDTLQGFLVGRPMSATAFTERLHAERQVSDGWNAPPPSGPEGERGIETGDDVLESSETINVRKVM